MQCLTSITRPRPPPPSCLTGHTAAAVARFGEVNSLSQDDPPPVPVPCSRSVPCSCGWAYHISKPTNLTIFSLMCAGHGKGIHRNTQEYTGLLAEYSLYLTFILFAVPLRVLAIAIVHNPHFVTFVEILLFLCFVCVCECCVCVCVFVVAISTDMGPGTTPTITQCNIIIILILILINVGRVVCCTLENRYKFAFPLRFSVCISRFLRFVPIVARCSLFLPSFVVCLFYCLSSTQHIYLLVSLFEQVCV